MSDNSLLTLYVHLIRYESAAIRSIELRRPDGGILPAVQPGAHIAVQLPDGDFRSYSLTNPDSYPRAYVVGVNRDPNSRGGSLYMCETLKVGHPITIRPPFNNFPLHEDAAQTVLFAGGIGITPILAMIRRLEALQKPWTLHYAARGRAHAAFAEELESYQSASPDRVHFHYDDERDGTYLDLVAMCAAYPEDTHFYCCGPSPMIAAFSAALVARPEDHVHVEHFSGTAAVAERSFQLVLNRSKRELKVCEGETIMQVMIDNGLFVKSSCREGVCGTCETRVLEGIPDHHDQILSARERASNKSMMICCSGAKSDRLVLDL